jgi:hypothetical protein
MSKSTLKRVQVDRLIDILGDKPSGFDAWSSSAKVDYLRGRLKAAGKSHVAFEQWAMAEALGISRHAVGRAERTLDDPNIPDACCGCVP